MVFVKELKGKLNTQRDEQIHASYNHDSRYLNNMKPVNHIYLFRSNIDIRNENINQRLKTGLTSCFKYEISIDENGCAVIDKSTKLTQNNGNLDKRKGSSSEEQANFGEKEDHQFEKKVKSRSP